MDKRAAFVLDASGNVRYLKVYDPGRSPKARRCWNSSKL